MPRPREIIAIRLTVDVELSFWQALKLRLAGASYVEGYVKCLLEERIQRQHDEDE